MSSNFNLSSSAVVSFKRGGMKELALSFLCGVAITGLLCLIDLKKWSQLYPTPISNITAFFLSGALLSAIWCFLSKQRVEIDIKSGSVRFSNITTHHRWRTFNACDVTSIQLRDGLKQGVLGLYFGLVSSPGRSWGGAYIINTGGGSDRDSEIFVTLVQQVTAAHPDMTVKNLPPEYKGRLPIEK